MSKRDALIHPANHAMPAARRNACLESSLISLAHDDEVREWAASLGCSEHDLREAVSVVGHSADEVRRYLSYRRH